MSIGRLFQSARFIWTTWQSEPVGSLSMLRCWRRVGSGLRTDERTGDGGAWSGVRAGDCVEGREGMMVGG